MGCGGKAVVRFSRTAKGRNEQTRNAGLLQFDKEVRSAYPLILIVTVTLTSDVQTMNVVTKNRRASTWMLIACGIWLVGLGLYFIVLRPPLLPEDQRLMGTTLAQVRTAVPGLESWLKKVFTVMGGFMAGAGVLTVFVATVALPPRLKGTSWAIALSGALTVALMSATNFALYSDFRWLLLVPALVWLAGLVFYISGH